MFATRRDRLASGLTAPFTPPGTIMIGRRDFLIALCIGAVFPAGGVLAAEPSATAFVEAIYAPYKGKDAKGVALDTDAAVKRYFDPRLAALISRDRNKAAQRGEVSTLDMDPFIDAQDWDISTVDVAVRDTGAGKASATVSFKNLDKPTTVVLDLVKLREGWRIADIDWGRKPTLRGLFIKR
jgi:uncharacterized protein DUF3828